MSRIIRQGLFVFILIITIVLVWNDFREHEGDKGIPQPNYLRKAKISALPEDIAESLSLLEKRAINKRKEINKRGFRLDIFSLTKEKKIESSTPLILQTYYDGSDQLVQRVTTMPDSFVGLSAGELSSIADDWEVKEYDPGKALVLYRKVDDLSPEDKKIMHLGIKDGKVAIFYGESGERYLKQMTEIQVSDLPYSEQEALKGGIVVHSREELLSILEGLIAIIQD
ncbi:MAG: hypothetical protein PWR10_1347 [Halanaerobiales bacterium]|nr:hypothetical protein [Halanaerobiales bacterium]